MVKEDMNIMKRKTKGQEEKVEEKDEDENIIIKA